MNTTKLFLITLATAVTCVGQILPEGTKVRVRMEEMISSATAEEGQRIELSVADNVLCDGRVAIPEGTRVTGTIARAETKKRMGRAGKLDFTVDRIVISGGETIPLRYSMNKRAGESHAVSTGIITAGVALFVWPAAPLVLLRHGKDISINKGLTFDVFTDTAHAMSGLAHVSGRKESEPLARP